MAVAWFFFDQTACDSQRVTMSSWCHSVQVRGLGRPDGRHFLRITTAKRGRRSKSVPAAKAIAAFVGAESSQLDEIQNGLKELKA
jgi:hypothetical protein